MKNNSFDVKTFISIENQINHLLYFINSYSLAKIEENNFYLKIYNNNLLRLARTYSSLGGRYKKEMGDYHLFLKNIRQNIEVNKDSKLFINVKNIDLLTKLSEHIKQIIANF